MRRKLAFDFCAAGTWQSEPGGRAWSHTGSASGVNVPVASSLKREHLPSLQEHFENWHNVYAMSTMSTGT